MQEMIPIRDGASCGSFCIAELDLEISRVQDWNNFCDVNHPIVNPSSSSKRDKTVRLQLPPSSEVATSPYSQATPGFPSKSSMFDAALPFRGTRECPLWVHAFENLPRSHCFLDSLRRSASCLLVQGLKFMIIGGADLRSNNPSPIGSLLISEGSKMGRH